MQQEYLKRRSRRVEDTVWVLDSPNLVLTVYIMANIPN
jgi:hypothetical protein